MNRLSLRNNRLKFKIAGKLAIILEEFIEYTPNLIKENRRMSTCNRLDVQTLGSLPIMLKNLPDHCFCLHKKKFKRRSPNLSIARIEVEFVMHIDYRFTSKLLMAHHFHLRYIWLQSMISGRSFWPVCKFDKVFDIWARKKNCMSINTHN
jgi:hypothetical protein